MTLPPFKALIAGMILLLAAAPSTNAQEARTGRQDSSLAATENTVVKRKLASIIIPHLEFHATTLENAVEFLHQESRRLDTDPDLDARGVNILLQIPFPAAPAAASTGATAAASTRITLTLNQVPLREALQYVALQAGFKLKVEPYAVSLVPLAEVTDAMVTAVFHVPPSLLNQMADKTNRLDQEAQ
jgi:general secretion pathway protein D